MRHLILHNSENRMFKKDATGAFIPEAQALFDYLTSSPANVLIAKRGLGKGTRWQKRKRVKNILGEFSGANFDAIWFLCHGYPNGIEHGFSGEKGAADLVDSILKYHPNVNMINFYACLVARGEGSFCKLVHDELYDKTRADRAVVFGHTTAGHTTFNPNIKIFGGYPWPEIYPQGTKEMKKKFISKIQDPKSNYRFELPSSYTEERKNK